MSISNPDTQSRIFNFLPEQVQLAIVAYANEVGLPIDAIITFAITHFLELESISLDNKHRTEGSSILDDLPVSLQSEIKNYAAEDEMPPEFVVELAIAHFLDPDSVTFDDCIIGLQRDRVELLRQQKRDRQATAA